MDDMTKKRKENGIKDYMLLMRVAGLLKEREGWDDELEALERVAREGFLNAKLA